jgi:hypothetical protein
MAHNQLRTFSSLSWYEESLTFLFAFAAKTSELLLAAGLVVSTANFLTDGSVMGSNLFLAHAWAWAQALAIDSSLGITFYSIIACIKERDWLKALLYGLLTLLLAVVAGTITNIDTFSHALHLSIASATTQVGFNVKVLTTLRAIAVVGFVMMSRLKEVSFRTLYAPTHLSHTDGQQQTPPRLTEAHQPADDAHSSQTLDSWFHHLTPEARTHLAHLLSQQQAPTVIEEQETQILPLLPLQHEENRAQPDAANALSDQTVKETTDASEASQEKKLEHAYQELLSAGERISGRALAKRAHVHRMTCNEWLRQRQASL